MVDIDYGRYAAAEAGLAWFNRQPPRAQVAFKPGYPWPAHRTR